MWTVCNILQSLQAGGTMGVQIARVGNYFINLHNIAYIHMTTPAIVENTFIDIVFTSGEEKIRLKGKEAIDLVNFFESTSKIVSP